MKTAIVYASTHHGNTKKLLDAIVDYMPSPVDIPAIDGVNPDTGEEDVRHADDNAPFSGLCLLYTSPSPRDS